MNSIKSETSLSCVEYYPHPKWTQGLNIGMLSGVVVVYQFSSFRLPFSSKFASFISEPYRVSNRLNSLRK